MALPENPNRKNIKRKLVSSRDDLTEKEQFLFSIVYDEIETIMKKEHLFESLTVSDIKKIVLALKQTQSCVEDTYYNSILEYQKMSDQLISQLVTEDKNHHVEEVKMKEQFHECKVHYLQLQHQTLHQKGLLQQYETEFTIREEQEKIIEINFLPREQDVSEEQKE
jgi:hypothetical protein